MLPFVIGLIGSLVVGGMYFLGYYHGAKMATELGKKAMDSLHNEIMRKL